MKRFLAGFLISLMLIGTIVWAGGQMWPGGERFKYINARSGGLVARDAQDHTNIFTMTKDGITLTPLVTATAGHAGKDLQVDTINLSSAEILALNGTPQILVGNAGANTIIVVESIMFAMDSTATAYAGVAAGENIMIEYETSGTDIITFLETVGFIDQTSNEIRVAQPLEVTGDLVSSINKDVLITILVGEIITGTGDMDVTIAYRVMPTGF